MRSAVLPVVFALAFSHAGADHCDGYTSSEPEAVAGPYYLDADMCQHEGCVFNIWVYEESNGLPGLQRADENIDDTCHGEIRGDTIIL